MRTLEGKDGISVIVPESEGEAVNALMAELGMVLTERQKDVNLTVKDVLGIADGSMHIVGRATPHGAMTRSMESTDLLPVGDEKI